MRKLEDKKTEEKQVVKKPMDAVEMEKMKGITDLLQEFLYRKFGYELEFQEGGGPEQEPPEYAIFAVWEKDKTKLVDAQSLIPKFPDWLRPFAKARLMAGGNLLLLWWGKFRTPQAHKVYEGVTAELEKMGSAEPTPAIHDEDEEEG